MKIYFIYTNLVKHMLNISLVYENDCFRHFGVSVFNGWGNVRTNIFRARLGKDTTH